ncbi:uro-adherence factor A [Thunnus thynnus]|uniref:uro-adherence factor A n=1 Tax=Thunnus thynnus TaxID=8237 RepID=UPI0035289453
MATKPVAWQEQGPANSLNEWVSESRMQGEVGASLNSPLQNKKAPRAEPEEDIDILEPGAQDKTQEMVTELAPQLSETTQAHEESEKCMNLLGEDALPSPPHLGALSTEECFEKESFFSLEGEVAEWISDVEIISNPVEDCMFPQTSQLTEPVDREVISTSEEMTGDEMTTEENLAQLKLSLDVFSNSEPENHTSGAAAAADGTNSTVHHFPPDRNKSDDVYTAGSPPFADESEEEEEMSMDVTSCQQQQGAIDIRSKPFQSSNPANVSIVPTSALTAVTSTEQQEELLSQGQCEPAPKGTNQEAAQQVFSQSSAPLSTVAMESSNQGGAASQGSGCVVTVRERHSGAGERTEGDSETGGEEGQKESGLERNKTVEQQHGGGLLRSSKTDQIQEQKTEKYSCGVSSKHISHTRMESDSCDDSQSDSGVSADFSPCSTLEGSTTIPTGSPATVPKETPIEREIRRAIAREQSLRRSRGLPNPPTSPEYVDVPLRKTVLSQPLPAKSEKCQGKDREFAGKKMQHEIHEEARREQDLVKLGKVPGFYDKGTVRQLKERQQLFEAFQKPSDSTLTISSRSKPTSWSSASDISTLENQEDISSQASTVGGSDVERRRSLDLLSPSQSPNSANSRGSTSSTPRGPGFSEGTSCQVVILENNLSVPAQRLYHAKQEAEAVTAVDSGAPYVSPGGIIEREQEKEEEMAPKENPFFKLRSSTNLVELDIREAQEREKELRKQRISLYGGTEGAKEGVGEAGGSGRSSSMEGKSPKLSSSSLNGLAVPDLPGSSSRGGGTGSPAARQSIGKFSVWPPAQAEEEKIHRPESPRTPRQKTPLVQRWESGLVNRHNEEDDD